MKINNNIQALNAYRNLYQNQSATSKNLEKLSSGLRINRAADDAAGLAISEKMRSQIRGLKQAERNSMDGISLMQTAEGALQEVHSILQRMRELAVQGANDTNTEYDREQIQKEIEQLKLEIDSISEKTEFNTRKLLNGSSAVLSSISKATDNAASVVGTPKVVDPNLESGVYHVKVTNTREIVKYNQVGAGISADSDAIKLNDELRDGDKYYPQAFGEYTINVRNYLENEVIQEDGTPTTQVSARIEVIGPNGLPIEDRAVGVGKDGEEYTIGGLKINTKEIGEAGTIKVSIEQQGTFSVYRGDTVDDETKIAADKTLVTRNGKIKHGGLEFQFDNSVSTPKGSIGSIKLDDVDVIIDAGEENGDYGNITIEFKTGPGENVVFADEKLTITLNEGVTAYAASDIQALINSKGVTSDVNFENFSVSFDGTIDATKDIGGEFILTNQDTKFSITNNALAFQIGPNTNQNVMIDVPRLDIVTLGIEEIDVTTQASANEAIFVLDQAINILSDVRSKLGATQNRMEHTINNLQVTHENLTSAESRIRDADMALEMTEFTRNNILNQSATAMLAQANQLPQGVLQLLQ